MQTVGCLIVGLRTAGLARLAEVAVVRRRRDEVDLSGLQNARELLVRDRRIAEERAHELAAVRIFLHAGGDIYEHVGDGRAPTREAGAPTSRQRTRRQRIARGARHGSYVGAMIRGFPFARQPFAAMERANVVADDTICIVGLLDMLDDVLEHAPIERAPRGGFRMRRDFVHHLLRMCRAPFRGRIDLDARKDELVARRVGQSVRKGVELRKVVFAVVQPPLARRVALVVHRPDVARQPYAGGAERLEHLLGRAGLRRRRRHDRRRGEGLAVTSEARHAADTFHPIRRRRRVRGERGWHVGLPLLRRIEPYAIFPGPQEGILVVVAGERLDAQFGRVGEHLRLIDPEEAEAKARRPDPVGIGTRPFRFVCALGAGAHRKRADVLGRGDEPAHLYAFPLVIQSFGADQPKRPVLRHTTLEILERGGVEARDDDVVGRKPGGLHRRIELRRVFLAIRLDLALDVAILGNDGQHLFQRRHVERRFYDAIPRLHIVVAEHFSVRHQVEIRFNPVRAVIIRARDGLHRIFGDGGIPVSPVGDTFHAGLGGSVSRHGGVRRARHVRQRKQRHYSRDKRRALERMDNPQVPFQGEKRMSLGPFDRSLSFNHRSLIYGFMVESASIARPAASRQASSLF